MAKSKDYYKTLGVEKSATKEQIKKAYKKLVMKYHPDRAPEEKKKDFEEKFKEINEAASVLGDEKKRAQYDQFGSAAFSGGAGGAGFQGFDFSDIMSQFNFGNFGGGGEDIFDQLFGGGGRSRRGARLRRGANLLSEVDLTLEEVANGVKKEIKVNKLEHCGDCKGKGGKDFQSCSHCSGSGYVKRTQRTPFGIFQQTGPCPYCHAKGEVANTSCKTCHGEGLERKKKTIEVAIPAGVESGMRLRLSGEGAAGPDGGPYGDLFVEVHVREHEHFTRNEADLHITVPISFTQAVLGDSIEVPTIHGKAKLKIPKGTDSETIFRMRGQGLPKLRASSKGDQMVKVRIQVPKKTTKKQKELLEKLKEEKPSKSFLKRVFG